MKKGWKIALISVGSLLTLIIVGVAVLCWLLFTPARLTSIVNSLAKDYILCENHFGNVSLSLFKTWPNVGVQIDDVVLINPYQVPADDVLAACAIHDDTLARVKSLTVGLDLKAFLKDRSVVVHQVRLDDTRANLYTAPDGWSNLDIFPPSTDEEEPDNQESQLPDVVQLEKISINNLSAQYCNLPQRMLAEVGGLDLDIKGSLLHSVIDADLKATVDKLLVDMRDSTGNSSLCAHANDLELRAEGQGATDSLQGRLRLVMPSGMVSAGQQTFTTEAMLASRHDLLTLDVPFHANVDKMRFTLDDASLSLTDYEIGVQGYVAMARDDKPMNVDLRLQADRWQVGDLIAILPSFITQSLSGMKVDGKASLSGHVHGVVADGRLPLVDADVTLEKGSFSAPKMLPEPLRAINAKLSANLNLSTDTAFSGISKMDIQQLDARLGHSSVSITGTVDDLMGDMLVDARLKGNLNLPDLRPFLPDTMPIDLAGTSRIDLTAKSRLSALTAVDLNKIRLGGNMHFKDLNVRWDSIHASSPQLSAAVALPTKRHSRTVAELIGLHVVGGKLDVNMENTGMTAQVSHPDIRVGIPNILDDRVPLAAAFNIGASKLNVYMDSMIVYSDTLRLNGSVRNDTTQDNILKQWNPVADIEVHRAVLSMSNASEAVRMPWFKAAYRPESTRIEHADVLWGVSDYHLDGTLYGLEDWLSHKAMLRGDINFTSQYADVDQLMAILSGMGSDEDTLQQQRVEDNVPKEANPFIVPKDVRVKLNTNITRCIAFGNDLSELGGSLTVNDGVAVLEQIGFTCKAARMQLTGIYESPRVNNLFVGLDFHLLDIQIDELLDMIPTIDTLVPMLKAFKGQANFHLATECNLDAFYQPKMSTLLGAAAINGKDLVVMDNQSVATMAKLLQFKNWREKDNNIGIDSISVEAQVFRKEIMVYPFLLNLHNYQLCIAGQHNLAKNCTYHLELLKSPLPLRLAIDVKGNLSKPKIELGDIRYGEMYIPDKSDAFQQRTLELKGLVRKALEANVR